MRFLILGSGVGLRTYLPVLEARYARDEFGLITRTPSAAKKLLEERIRYFSQDLRKSIDIWNPDFVCVGLPPWKHLATAQELTGYRGRVLFEKPMGLTLNEAKKIADVLPLDRSFVNFQLRGHPALKYMKEEITSLSNCVSLIRITERSQAFINNSERKWYFEPGRGGGQCLSMLIHLVDLSLFLLGEHHPNQHTTQEYFWQSNPPHTAATAFKVNETFVQISSSSNAFDNRYFACEVLADDRQLKFTYTDGEATLVLRRLSSSDTLFHTSGNEMSLFRTSFYDYFEDVVNGSKSVARPVDAVSALRILGECGNNK